MNPTPESETAELEHRFQSWGFIFLFGFFLPALALNSLVFDPERSGGVLAIAALALAPLAWWLLREAVVRIRVSPAGIEAGPRWGKGPPTLLSWRTVTAIRYRTGVRVVQIEGLADQGPVVVQVSLLRENLGTLARLVRTRAPRKALDPKARKLFRVD